jgi:CubicO group peptidase (beta-lactamase class C family)
VVAQQLALDVSGDSFPAFVRTRVLIPAGMVLPPSNNRFPPPSPHSPPSVTPPALRPFAGDAHVYPELAAAGLWTTPSDLARFALAIRAALDGQPSFLTRATATAMITPPLADTNYGLGLGVLGAGENLQLAHTGSNAGFRSSLCSTHASAAARS